MSARMELHRVYILSFEDLNSFYGHPLFDHSESLNSPLTRLTIAEIGAELEKIMQLLYLTVLTEM